MDYQEALDYLYSFIDYERKPAATPEEAAFNLVRMRALLTAVGDPQVGLPAVVVAGTKGKGSTCALIEHMVRAAGYRTGLWSSPHLSSYRERIQIDRQLISQAELAEAVARLRPTVERFDTAAFGRPSVFELGFALALRHFAEQDVQFAVLEVGMGGRYDAANVITPLVSAISSVSYDHMHVLGHTLAEIADNKAGILKPGTPGVTVPQHPEAAAVLRQVAEDVGAPLWVAGEQGLELEGQGGERVAGLLPYPVLPMPARLRGAVQQENARLALGVALLLSDWGLRLPPAALAEGLAAAEWPGRLEVVGQAPLMVLDGAHNGDSAEKLIAMLRAEFHFERLILVLGTSRDKDIPAIVAALAPAADTLIITRSQHPRAQTDLDLIADAARPYARAAPLIAPEVADALYMARNLANPADLICVTGSLFVVGAVRVALGLAVAD